MFHDHNTSESEKCQCPSTNEPDNYGDPADEGGEVRRVYGNRAANCYPTIERIGRWNSENNEPPLNEGVGVSTIKQE